MTANDQQRDEVSLPPIITERAPVSFRTPSPPPPRRLSVIPPPPLLVRQTNYYKSRRPPVVARRNLMHRMPPLLLNVACTEDTPLPQPSEEPPLLPRGPLISPQRVVSSHPTAQQAYTMAFARVQTMLWDAVRANIDRGSSECIATVPKTFVLRGVATPLEDTGYKVEPLNDQNHHRCHTLVLTRLRISWDMFAISATPHDEIGLVE